jgi:outer membrane protein assembly factor BamB
MRKHLLVSLTGLWLLVTGNMAVAGETLVSPAVAKTLKQIGISRGVCAVVGLAVPEGDSFVVGLANASELTIYFQSPRAEEVAAVRKKAAAAGLLGTRVFADRGDLSTIHLADNLADALVASPGAANEVAEAEALRVVHPDGVALLGDRRLVGPARPGVDSWSHVFHGPDNNPLSTDQVARAPYLTQFLADPKFCPMPEVSVAAGGRVFRAFGHIAHSSNQNALLNTLLCVNGYNGTILWRRPLHEGFMIHRNTMIATPDVLYLSDDESCNLLDARTGEVKAEIVVPEGLADGPVWKWMALQDGVLYALVGGVEVRPKTQPSQTAHMGHWPWGMWEGHDYKDPATNFGFGRTFLAIDPATKKVLWSHREQDYIDARGVAMRNGRIYFYSPGKSLGCLDAAAGKPAWKNSDRDLLAAIGRDDPAQFYVKGYATTTFMKCDDRHLFFAGPQRTRMVVASTENGKILWQNEVGNLQLVLRDDSVYCAGPEKTYGFKLDYETGRQLGILPARRACTRATGTVDSVFFRATGGTVRIDVASGTGKHVAPMRPPCQDGVIASDGLLYWGPWMCGCELSLYGHIALGPAGKFNFHPTPDDTRLVAAAGDLATVQPLEVQPGDWPTYLGDNARSAVTKARLPKSVTRAWTSRTAGGVRPSAPIMAGGRVFFGDASGAVRALDAKDGSVQWQAFTGGAIFFPPALWQGRLYVGSADGRVYAFEAATGRPLWTFRAAPAERWIPVYGKLISTWPVAGGVVAADGVVYAAAGIAHYDGTYVYALDAVTGKLKWCNDRSGNQAASVDCGVSLQGGLHLADGELRFLAGNKYETARYDLATGKCLNSADDTLKSQFRTAFYPYYSEYGRYMSLSHTLPDGRELCYDAGYEGTNHSVLSLFRPPAPGATKQPKDAARWFSLMRKTPPPPSVWTDKARRRFHAFVVAADTLLAAGCTASGRVEHDPFLAAMEIATGAEIWREPLPAASVPGGIAVDHQGRIVVTLEGGQVLAFARR